MEAQIFTTKRGPLPRSEAICRLMHKQARDYVDRFILVVDLLWGSHNAPSYSQAWK